MIAHRWVLGLALATLLLAPAATHADLVYNATLNTAPLMGNPAGPFSLDFQLVGVGNNTVTLSNFQFGGGAAVTFGTGLNDWYSYGGFSGTANSSVTLTDTAYNFNEFTQQFTPGSTLSFQIDITTNVATPFPDQFAFGILDSAGADIPMLNSPTNAFLLITLDSSTSPQVQTFANDPNSPDSASGGYIGDMGPFGLLPGLSAAPEPASLTLVAVGMMTLGGWKLRALRRRRKAST